jgi:cation:H+ antiporter
MFLELVLIIVGLIILWKGSDFTVDAAKRLAKKFNISHAVLGLTLVSIGTSLPEIFTNVYVGLRVYSGAEVDGIAVGVILGSQITQITLILGTAALLGTMFAKKHTFRREVPMLFIALGGLWISALDGFVHPLEALILIIMYFGYLSYLNKYHQVSNNIKLEMKHKKRRHINAPKQLALAILGLVLLIIGGKLVVDNAEILAMEFGVSQSLIAILIIGPGAALPELTVAIQGMRRKASGISLGALLGSNITDPMFSFGIGAIIAGYQFEEALLWFDMPYWLMATCIAVLFIWTGRRIGRKNKKEGFALIGIFVLFVILKLWLFL